MQTVDLKFFQPVIIFLTPFQIHLLGGLDDVYSYRKFDIKRTTSLAKIALYRSD